MTKRKLRGRPPGPYNGKYLPSHLRRELLTIRLPKWVLDRVKNHENPGQYIEKLIIADNGWNVPKK